MKSSSDTDEELCLHEMAFNNDVLGVTDYLNRNKDVLSKKKPVKDMHGNTPLHLAVMLGHHEIAKLLVQNGHGISNRNHQGWTPLQESISYGNISTIETLLEHSGHIFGDTVLNFPKIMEEFTRDIRIKFHWELTSWVPLASRMLPSDTCTVYCTKNAVRMDSTLEEFRNLKWVRGHISRILEFTNPSKPRLLFLNNSKNCYFKLECFPANAIDSLTLGTVDELMENEIIQTSIKMDQVKITPQKSGWFRRSNKEEQVGNFKAEVYNVSNVKLITIRRQEHLEESSDTKETGSIGQRKSLPPPTPPKLTWNQYRKMKENYTLGRPRKEKQSLKVFEGDLWLSTDFPIKRDLLLSILEVVLPHEKLYKRIREFTDIQLPKGFPVRITVPLVPTVTATVSFVEFEYCDGLDPSLFQVPSSFKRVVPSI